MERLISNMIHNIAPLSDKVNQQRRYFKALTMRLMYSSSSSRRFIIFYIAPIYQQCNKINYHSFLEYLLLRTKVPFITILLSNSLNIYLTLTLLENC